MKPKNNILILIAVLALALVGIFIMQQKANLNKRGFNDPPTILTSPSSSPVAEKEKWILAPPPATASAELKKKHAETVAKIAQSGSVLAIKGCRAEPLVLAVKQDSEFEIKNEDSVTRKIMIDEDHVYELPTQKSVTVKASFKYGAGDYGYICTGEGLVGFLHVTS